MVINQDQHGGLVFSESDLPRFVWHQHPPPTSSSGASRFKKSTVFVTGSAHSRSACAEGANGTSPP